MCKRRNVIFNLVSFSCIVRLKVYVYRSIRHDLKVTFVTFLRYEKKKVPKGTEYSHNIFNLCTVIFCQRVLRFFHYISIYEARSQSLRSCNPRKYIDVFECLSREICICILTVPNYLDNTIFFHCRLLSLVCRCA